MAELSTEERFSNEEVRILGAMLEKEVTTPEYYPMSVNGLKNACNQKSNRWPVVQYDDAKVLDTLDQLRRKQLIIIVSGPGTRVRKYEHRLKDMLHLSQKEKALLCGLMVRGPQTVGELRTRSERMISFENLIEVETTLDDLMSPERMPFTLVSKLPVAPRQKDPRYAHLLCGRPDIHAVQEVQLQESPHQNTQHSPTKIDELSELVEQLSQQLKHLKTEFESFKRQFD